MFSESQLCMVCCDVLQGSVLILHKRIVDIVIEFTTFQLVGSVFITTPKQCIWILGMVQYATWDTCMENFFSNIGFFHCLFFFSFRPCDAQIATKITSGYNIWETKQTQEKYSRRGRSMKTGNMERRVKRCQNKSRLGGQRGRSPGERPWVHLPAQVPQESSENCGVTWRHGHTEGPQPFHLCFTQKSWPPSKPNNIINFPTEAAKPAGLGPPAPRQQQT